MIATPQPRLAVFVKNNLLHCWNSIPIFFPSHLIWTLRAANTETTDRNGTAVSLLCLWKTSFYLSLPLQSQNHRQISSLGKKMMEKRQSWQPVRADQAVSADTGPNPARCCVPFKSKGNEDAQHFQGWGFGISAFYQKCCLRTANTELSGTADCGVPWWGSDAVQEMAQAGYHIQGILSELQKLQHHFHCRGHMCEFCQ